MAHPRSFLGVHAIRITCVALVLGFAVGLRLDAASATSRGAQAKAAALSNVIAFTEWPKTAFATMDAPLVLGVFGEGPVADLLDQYLANEEWLGRRITLRRVNSSSDARSCHAIFVAASEFARWNTIAREIIGRPILTVGDADGFANREGIVEFGIEHDKVKLRVNLSAARDAGLTLSSKLLRIAQIVGDPVP
jgi:hypothetical protein